MTRYEKEEFRKSNKWRSFRTKVKKQRNGIDFITKHPLVKTWNLHHLDMRDKNYTDISKSERFMPLNEDTHKFIHWLFCIWKKDKGVLVRLEHVLELMKQYSND